MRFGGPELFHTWAERALAESFRLSPDVTGPEPTLNSVILPLARQGKRQSAYIRLVTLAQETNLEPPEALRQLAASEAILGPGRIRPETWNERSIYDDQQMLHFDSHQSSMPKFIKHPKYSDGFDTAAYPMTIQQFSYGERLGALTLVYLELSLPLQVALRAAEADLCQLEVGECARPG